MDQNQIERLSQQLASSDAIVIGAGADYPHQQASHIPGSGLSITSRTLLPSITFLICTPAASILLIRWKNIGLIGADTFSAIVIGMPRSRFIKNCCL